MREKEESNFGLLVKGGDINIVTHQFISSLGPLPKPDFSEQVLSIGQSGIELLL